jgi:hypothetical protein
MMDCRIEPGNDVEGNGTDDVMTAVTIADESA